uniref:C-type lectin domain family 4 member M-like isoform X2 n=1 Tax=Gasterosteus aculeatus aculeatus TaxID=481459 RepID=UPI001A9961E2|nr:C-type lectin domain family 4 member M-like isoform X2 [Gasterosteus aculeatus aculeatus]
MDAMEIDDSIYIKKNFAMDGLGSQVVFPRRKQPFRCATVCLGLLSAVLLAGNIAQFVYYEIISRPASAEPTQASGRFQGDRLQGGCDASAAERQQLEAKLSNLTEDEGQLQQSYSALTAERDEFKASFSNLRNKSDQLQASYNTLKEERDQLKTSYDDMQKSLEGLQADHKSLQATKDQLQTNYRTLQREKEEFQALSVTLRANRDQLQSDYSSLQRNKDQLQISCNTLSTSKDALQTRYNSLTRDKGQLQSRHNSLQREKEQLQNSYSSLTKDKDELEKKINKVRAKPCQRGWRKFDMSCYYISTARESWRSSRANCNSKGADLVIIDSSEEQMFVNEMMTSGQNAWIGLTDSAEEGTWTWVDGTPVNTTYWQDGQPNSFKGNQDCGETLQSSSGVGEWNDNSCSNDQIFICEQ